MSCMPAPETNTRKIISRLEREGWVNMLAAAPTWPKVSGLNLPIKLGPVSGGWGQTAGVGRGDHTTLTRRAGPYAGRGRRGGPGEQPGVRGGLAGEGARLVLWLPPPAPFIVFDPDGGIVEITAVPTTCSVTPCSPPSRRGLATAESASPSQRRPSLTASARGVSEPRQVGTKKRPTDRTKKLTRKKTLPPASA
jgi:hypothetical protein